MSGKSSWIGSCPRDTKFKQQTLSAWQPVITASTVLPLLFVVGVVFVPIGAILLYATIYLVHDVTVDYTNCVARPANPNNPRATCAELLIASLRAPPRPNGSECVCDIDFKIKDELEGQVYMYYALSNFYQNHRRYVKSVDRRQLYGSVASYDDLSVDCEPLRGVNHTPYAPCGAIANSLFNDTLTLTYNSAKVGRLNIPLIKAGIAWGVDRKYLYANPTGALAQTPSLPPPYWRKSLADLDPARYLNEDLMVWMRTAAFPSFRKLYRRINHDAHPGVLGGGLPTGDYTLHVTYTYPVTQFGGGKSMLLSTTSWYGGRNYFLSIAYLIIGALSTLGGVVFSVLHLSQRARLEELVTPELLNDETPYFDQDET